MLARTSPLLHVRPDLHNGKLTLTEPMSKKEYAGDPDLLFPVLEFCLRSRTAEEVFNFLTVQGRKQTPDDARALMRDLMTLGLLLQEGDTVTAAEQARNKWFAHGWVETWYFHTALYDYPFADYQPADSWMRDEALMNEYADTGAPPPPIYKEYEGKEITLLPEASVELMKGLTFGAPAQEYPFTTELLSAICYLGFGETGSIELPVLGKSLLKTSPSGGARHPAEAYVYLLNKDAGQRGIYHYSVKDHGLVGIGYLEESRVMGNTFHYLTHKPGFTPSAIFVLSDIYRRSMWRYREPRSMRAVLLDLGHIVTTLKFIAKSMGYDVVDSHGFDEKQVNTDLGLDDPTEKPMYFVAFGKYEGKKQA